MKIKILGIILNLVDKGSLKITNDSFKFNLRLITNVRDGIWVNTIAFMFAIQPLPERSFGNNKLSVQPINNNYEWYLDGEMIENEDVNSLNVIIPGIYQAQVTFNGGCQKSVEIET